MVSCNMTEQFVFYPLDDNVVCLRGYSGIMNDLPAFFPLDDAYNHFTLLLRQQRRDDRLRIKREHFDTHASPSAAENYSDTGRVFHRRKGNRISDRRYPR